MIVVFTHGSYSSYMVSCVMEWLRPEITLNQAKDSYRLIHPRAGLYKFMAWLVREGYARDVEAAEVWENDSGNEMYIEEHAFNTSPKGDAQ